MSSNIPTGDQGENGCREGIFIGGDRLMCNREAEHSQHSAQSNRHGEVRWSGQVGNTEYSEPGGSAIMSKEGNVIARIGKAFL